VLLRLVRLFALVLVLLTANGELQARTPAPTCCEPEAEKLSQPQVKALVKKTEPIYAPCCAEMLHISGIVVLEISVDAEGNVTCVRMVSGHPLIIGVTIQSVSQWKFQPYTSRGSKKSFCGQIAIRFEGNEHRVKYTIL